MLPLRTTVLIVGAGPTGLAAAVAFLHQGFRDILVIDAVPRDSRPLSSRAIVVHAATLEALDAIGCAEPLVAVGHKGKRAKIYAENELVMDIDFDDLAPHTPYAFGLLVSQYSTERILEAKLEEMGMTVHRPRKLVGLDDGGSEEGLVATFESGETVRAKYVVGADGARSVVRQLLNIDYSDSKGEHYRGKGKQMVTGDVTYKSPTSLPRDQVVLDCLPDNYFISLPVPGSTWPETYQYLQNDMFRIAFCVPDEDGTPPHAPPAEYFQTYLDKINPKCFSSQRIEIDKVLWSTRFRVGASIADKFLVRMHSSDSDDKNESCRIVFLAGDAAHSHAPIGGQGMNLGLRDAINLAPVIMKHMELFPSDKKRADRVIEEYAHLRRTRAQATIELTKRTMSALFFFGKGGWATRCVLWVVRWVMKVLRRRWVLAASGLWNR